MSKRKWLLMTGSILLIAVLFGVVKRMETFQDAMGAKAKGELPEIKMILDFQQMVKEIKEINVPVEQDVFVDVEKYIPNVEVELKYAGTDNFTGKKIYDFTDAYLRYGTVKKLRKVQDSLKGYGMSLKIWDGFRPVSAQFVLWDTVPIAKYVANPNTGFSQHSRGNTVDLTLVNEDGSEVIMPTGFDDFSKKADRDYSDCSGEEVENALLLERLMVENGFKPYSGEWWHYTDLDPYPVENEFEPSDAE